MIHVTDHDFSTVFGTVLAYSKLSLQEIAGQLKHLQTVLSSPSYQCLAKPKWDFHY